MRREGEAAAIKASCAAEGQSRPVFTTESACQDCYKCVRHCHCKAIQIIDARAAILPNRCVSCGECVRVCPSHAKKIRSDLARAQRLVALGEQVHASIAPSFPGHYRGVSINRLAGALKRLGFAGVGETALGAQLVSARTAQMLCEVRGGAWLSSACPAAVEFIRKYHPRWASRILPVVSPVQAHARWLRQRFGQEVRTVFFGPCAAKKVEADNAPETLSLALTFGELDEWLARVGVSLAEVDEAPLSHGVAEEGRLYPIEGGMNETLRAPELDARLITVSGLGNLARLIERIDADAFDASGTKLFVEMLACEGGCLNGPAMAQGAGLDVIVEVERAGRRQASAGRQVAVSLDMAFTPAAVESPTPDEVALKKALESLGKFTAADELNCGACGYNSCRQLAAALVEGKAETSMCLSHLRRISQKTSNALIRYIPVAVVLADDNLQVVECNRNFAELCGEEVLTAYDACGNLSGAYLASLLPFTELFESVLQGGGEIEKFNQSLGDRILNLSVFAIAEGRVIGAILQDVTQYELKREQVAGRAREVIRKNVLTVQRIAHALGEHMADTEVLLSEIAGAWSDKPGEGA